jgi:uncharacterized protein YkwD
MLIVKMLLCASALTLGQTAAPESKPQPTPAQKIEIGTNPKTDKDARSKRKDKSNRPLKKGATAGLSSSAAQTTANGLFQRAANRKAARKHAAAKSPAVVKTTEKIVDGVPLSDVEANIVSYTNQERIRYGLPPFEVDKELTATAREQAAIMTRSGSLFHPTRFVAENIAMGQTHSSEAVQSWMGSAGHRANILNPAHRRIGVAAYHTADGVIFWCQQFQP